MKKLSREEVLHVAKLARLELSENEIEKFSYQLKELLDEINKINDIEVVNNDILISPWNSVCNLNEDNALEGLTEEEVLSNAPHKTNPFIEVRGVFDE